VQKQNREKYENDKVKLKHKLGDMKFTPPALDKCDNTRE